MTIPTILTLLRIALIPVFVAVFYLPVSWANLATAAMFVVAGVTDWFDGYLARRLNQTSPLGAFLDPVADKLMVAAALVLLVQSHPTAWLAVPAVIIIGREIAVSALREWMAEHGSRARGADGGVGAAALSRSERGSPRDDDGACAAVPRRGADLVVDGGLFACGMAHAHVARQLLKTSVDSARRVAKIGRLLRGNAGIAQLVERNLAKVEVASSSLVSRSISSLSAHFP